MTRVNHEQNIGKDGERPGNSPPSEGVKRRQSADLSFYPRRQRQIMHQMQYLFHHREGMSGA